VPFVSSGGTLGSKGSKCKALWWMLWTHNLRISQQNLTNSWTLCDESTPRPNPWPMCTSSPSLIKGLITRGYMIRALE